MRTFYFFILSIFTITASAQQKKATDSLRVTNLKGVDISAATGKSAHMLSKIDLQLQPVKSAQDLLRTVPGLFIAQHAGGGKAEQILVRGIDNDHGTDFGIFVDGIPVNLPNHAHGQGYADMHFLIPEVIGGAAYYKGPYEASQGDFTNAGAAVYTSLFRPQDQFVKLEYGQFNTARATTLLKLLDKQPAPGVHDQNAYIAADYTYTDSYFDNSQKFKRFNLLGRYNIAVNKNNTLSLIASGFTSSWNASGQVPLRALESGYMTRFGSIDPSEGGKTTRINANLLWDTKISERSALKQQAYYVRNLFDLWSNFTFYKEDRINGDEIRQWEKRDIIGYKNTFNHQGHLGIAQLESEAGLGVRVDMVNLGRDHVKERAILSNNDSSHVTVANYSFYISETLRLTNGWSFNLGLRNDLFTFDLRDHLDPANSGNSIAYRVSPKFNVYYDVSPAFGLFVKMGMGFHSNYANVAIRNGQENAVPRSYGSDIGANLKIGSKAIITATWWWLQSDAEYRFVADDGSYENIGRATRTGVDVALRYHVLHPLWADVNVNYARPRLMDAAPKENYIPFAPVFTSTGGLTWQPAKGINASLRYRYMGQRPAIEDNSVESKAYFLMDAVLKYNYKRFEFGLSAENLLNTKWAEAQFYDASQLKEEKSPVMDFHITPGTPFSLRGSVTVKF
ncbi:outer membrane receptor protein involved in Fe transport [Chitinophaga niastensis]|uniref:Outer membrane receptor protein involved in Fe transport n=1 Tax=Chitinophaga niastensis TaxID=536980 RepID=A0A2P8HGZ1_CHINA|nr:TonB-dependent receptor [Chitinophaga niastensis]PSL45476.1 outer membrane receptor protein involved in Fe transport [Chitinophaga niastensis]